MTTFNREPKGSTISSYSEAYHTSPAAAECTQVMTVDVAQVWALTVYHASLGGEFDIDPRDDTSNRGLKPIEELV